MGQLSEVIANLTDPLFTGSASRDGSIASTGGRPRRTAYQLGIPLTTHQIGVDGLAAPGRHLDKSLHITDSGAAFARPDR
jgi:hypothetical protein